MDMIKKCFVNDGLAPQECLEIHYHLFHIHLMGTKIIEHSAVLEPEALAEFWKHQKGTHWFESHPILSQKASGQQLGLTVGLWGVMITLTCA